MEDHLWIWPDRLVGGLFIKCQPVGAWALESPSLSEPERVDLEQLQYGGGWNTGLVEGELLVQPYRYDGSEQRSGSGRIDELAGIPVGDESHQCRLGLGWDDGWLGSGAWAEPVELGGCLSGEHECVGAWTLESPGLSVSQRVDLE